MSLKTILVHFLSINCFKYPLSEVFNLEIYIVFTFYGLVSYKFKTQKLRFCFSLFLFDYCRCVCGLKLVVKSEGRPSLAVIVATERSSHLSWLLGTVLAPLSYCTDVLATVSFGLMFQNLRRSLILCQWLFSIIFVLLCRFLLLLIFWYFL